MDQVLDLSRILGAKVNSAVPLELRLLIVFLVDGLMSVIIKSTVPLELWLLIVSSLLWNLILSFLLKSQRDDRIFNNGWNPLYKLINIALSSRGTAELIKLYNNTSKSSLWKILKWINETLQITWLCLTSLNDSC